MGMRMQAVGCSLCQHTTSTTCALKLRAFAQRLSPPTRTTTTLPAQPAPPRRNHCDGWSRKNDARLTKIQTFLSSPPTTPIATREFNGLMSKGDTYDISNFSQSHTAFKHFHNTVFASLLNHCDGGSAFYLDGPTCETTKFLLSQNSAASNLYSANIFEETVSHIREHLPAENVHIGRAEIVLESLSQTFNGVYLDSCGGIPEQPIAMMSALFRSNKMSSKYALGFTLTRASPCGKTLGDREVVVYAALARMCRQKGFRMCRVEDNPEIFGLDGNIAWRKEDNGTVTNWVVCSRLKQ